MQKDCDDIMRAAQLAACLEVSGTPKPGNVHRIFDFPDTRFEHFLAGGVALGPAARDVAFRAARCALGELVESQVEIGRCVRTMVSDVKTWHRGANTHLGTCLLFAPLAAAAGYTLVSRDAIGAVALRAGATRLMEATTVEDALEAYQAISDAGSAPLGVAPSSGAPDVRDESASDRLRRDGFSLWAVMKTASSWDLIAREWSTGMRVSFEVGYPAFREVLHSTKDVNTATVHAFLTVLASQPDTFIARKVGLKRTQSIEEAVEIGLPKASAVSQKAATVLDAGGLTTPEGEEALAKLDGELRASGGELNPGSSADLTASSLFIALLCGARF